MTNLRSLNLILALGVLALSNPSLSAGPQKAAHHYKFSAAQAKHIALKKYHGKVVGKIKLENEDGKWQYSVNVRSKKVLREVMVGANSGRIENVEVTTPREEAREAAAEAKKARKHG